MKQLLSLIQDHTGKISSTRTIVLVIVATILAPKIQFLLQSGGAFPDYTNGDVKMALSAFALKYLTGLYESKKAALSPEVQQLIAGALKPKPAAETAQPK